MRRLKRGLAVGLWFVGLAALAAANAEGAVVCVPPAVPGGVADPAGAAVYVTNAKGNVEAVDLKTGQTLWVSESAYRPLAVAGNKLIAQARIKDKPNAVRLVLLGLQAEGKLLKQSEELTVAAANEYDASSSSGGTGGGTTVFGMTASVDKGEAVVKWTGSYSTYRISGRPLPPEQAQSSGHSWGGWRLDLETGQAKPLAGGSVTDPQPAIPVPGKDKPKDSTEGDPKSPVPPAEILQKMGKDSGVNVLVQPWVDDGQGRMVVRKSLPEFRQEFYLWRWDVASGKASEPVLLSAGGSDVSGSDYITPDRGTIILKTGAVDPKSGEARGNYHLLLFSAAAGKRLADVSLEKPEDARLIGDGRAVLISRPSESDKNVRHVVLLTAASGERLREIDVPCGKDFKIEQAAGFVGGLVYTVGTGDGDAIPGGAVGTAVLTAFDAARGEIAWKKAFSTRRFAAPPYLGPFPPSRPSGPPPGPPK